MNQSILWRGIYFGGHEVCSLSQVNNEWRLEGTASFSSDNRACRLSYLVTSDLSWNTLGGIVSGWVGKENVRIELSVDTLHQWKLNGLENSAVNGCVDLDLNFSPSTNLLPIRRLSLGIGQHAEVEAAWLRFPSFELEPLAQVYTRVDEFKYRYSSGEGRFVCDLTVNEIGFVTDYPGFWQAVQ
jgi:uncharacterized protein